MGEYLHKEYEDYNQMNNIGHKKCENPKISIIIPVYNVEKYIRQALSSVVNQTLDDLEIIVVNDCSPDNSMLIVEEFARNDGRFVIINQEKNQGQGVARNRALDIARGEYIMFLDPDDWFELDACEKAYNQISTNQNDMVFFTLYSWKERKGKLGERKLNTTRLSPFEEVKNNPHINLRELKTNWFIGGWSVLQIYSKEFLKENKIRYSNNRYAEDLAFITTAMVKSKDISILDLPLYNYRKRESSSLVYTNCYKDVIETKENAYKIIENSEFSKEILNNFLLYEIGSNNTHFKKYTKTNRKIRKDFYSRIKKRFEEISAIMPEDIIKKSDAYKDFKLILACKSYEEYRLKRILRKVLEWQVF